jgi:hypothetical protein
MDWMPASAIPTYLQLPLQERQSDGLGPDIDELGITQAIPPSINDNR